jgi:hypothetical protein
VSRKQWSISEVVNLGAVTDLVTAGEILKMGRTKSYELARTGEFPVPIIRYGKKYVVPVMPILDLLRSCQG